MVVDCVHYYTDLCWVSGTGDRSFVVTSDRENTGNLAGCFIQPGCFIRDRYDLGTGLILQISPTCRRRGASRGPAFRKNARLTVIAIHGSRFARRGPRDSNTIRNGIWSPSGSASQAGKQPRRRPLHRACTPT